MYKYRLFAHASIGSATVMAAAVFAWTGVHALYYASEPTGPTVSGASHPLATTSVSVPARLQIPSLNVDANVQYVGVTGHGAMGVPDNFTDVAWYAEGTIPGQTGSAVMDGHVDNGLALPGVFKHLDQLHVGDDVFVVEKDGTRIRFQVIDIASYQYEDVPTDLIFARDDTARLNLITCCGSWVAGARTYDHRTVVFTELRPT